MLEQVSANFFLIVQFENLTNRDRYFFRCDFDIDFTVVVPPADKQMAKQNNNDIKNTVEFPYWLFLVIPLPRISLATFYAYFCFFFFIVDFAWFIIVHKWINFDRRRVSNWQSISWRLFSGSFHPLRKFSFRGHWNRRSGPTSPIPSSCFSIILSRSMPGTRQVTISIYMLNKLYIHICIYINICIFVGPCLGRDLSNAWGNRQSLPHIHWYTHIVSCFHGVFGLRQKVKVSPYRKPSDSLPLDLQMPIGCGWGRCLAANQSQLQ